MGITSLPYGCAAVICRELVARWDKGWPPLPLTLLVLLILDGATLWLLLRWSGNGFGWDDRHCLALIVGFLSFFIVFDFLQDADEWRGRGIVGVVAIVAFWRLAQRVNGRYAVVAKRADEAKLRVLNADENASMSRIGRLQTRLEEKANPKTKAWWERYLRNVIQFRGVKMAQIRAALHAWIDDEGIDEEFSRSDQKELALSLLREEYAEDKLAGILYLQEVLLPNNAIDWRTDLPRFARLFQDGYIYDWNTCDWFCVKVLGPLAEREGEECARSIAEWRTAENLWQRRASGVAFVNLAKHGDANFSGFTDMLLKVCSATAQHQERFAQTGTGWVLRELSLIEPERVAAFVEDHIDCFSSEGLRYATEKMEPEIQQHLRGSRQT